jgi:hypothetical protein
MDRTDEPMLDKVGKGGASSRRDSYLFHIVVHGTMEDVVRQVNGIPVDKQTRVYTYMGAYNTLLCGTEVVRKGIVPKLPSPPSKHPRGIRQFGTLTFSALRRLGRFM